MYKRQHPITILLGIRIASLLPLIILVLFKPDEQVEPWYLFYLFLLVVLFIMAIFQQLNGILKCTGLRIIFYI